MPSPTGTAASPKPEVSREPLRGSGEFAAGSDGTARSRTLFQDIDDTLRAEGGLAWAAWEYANEITRSGELVNSLGSRLGMTSAQLDELFITGGSISA